MKCPGCEYELWNLKAGPCPECGRWFKPSDFDFLPNAVKFQCPHCQQAYYGTSETGQLEPSEFECVSCGRHVTTDEMLLLPADELGRREPTRTPNPWLDPHKRGAARWFSAVGASLGQPGRMIEATPAIGSTGRALGFAMHNIVIAGLFSIVCGGAMLLTGGGWGIVLVLILMLGPAAYLFAWATATHWALKLFVTKTPDGMGRTVQAIAFSSGGWVMAIIPCLGAVIGLPAWAICATIAVKAAHKTTTWRAVLATLPVPVLTGLGIAALYLIPFVGFGGSSHTITAMPHGPAPAPSWQGNWAPNTDIRESTQRVADILRHNLRQGVAPRHVAYFAGEHGFDPLAFIEQGSGAPAIGPSNIWLLSMMDPAGREAVLDPIVASWPADVTTHRLGRILLTYHGVEGVDGVAHPDLWLMVQLPAEPQESYWAITMTGYEEVDRTNPQSAVDDQNRLRLAAGLDPLPDMATMLGDGPWTAADGVVAGPP